MKYYTFSQNNSGGSFDGSYHYVIIEAPSPEAANEIAVNLDLPDVDIYFDGCSDGRDCPCCGDRWYPQYDDSDGYDTPQVYSKPVKPVDDLKSVSFYNRVLVVPHDASPYPAAYD
jgi:hypothetical protein